MPGALSALCRRVRNWSTLAVGCEGECGANLLSFQVREVTEDIVLAHTTGGVVENVIDRDAKRANARFTSALARVDCDPITIIHVP